MVDSVMVSDRLPNTFSEMISKNNLEQSRTGGKLKCDRHSAPWEPETHSLYT